MPAGVKACETDGPFFLGAAGKCEDTFAEVPQKPGLPVIRMRSVPAIDSTAIHALEDLVRRTRGDGTRVLLPDVHAQPLVAPEWLRLVLAPHGRAMNG